MKHLYFHPYSTHVPHPPLPLLLRYPAYTCILCRFFAPPHGYRKDSDITASNASASRDASYVYKCILPPCTRMGYMIMYLVYANGPRQK